jgi:hypothetical protein
MHNADYIVGDRTLLTRLNVKLFQVKRLGTVSVSKK